MVGWYAGTSTPLLWKSLRNGALSFWLKFIIMHRSCRLTTMSRQISATDLAGRSIIVHRIRVPEDAPCFVSILC